MRKTITRAGIGFISVLLSIYNLLFFIIVYPLRRCYNHISDTNKAFITALPQNVRAELDVWDSFGFKQSQEYLRDLTLLKVLGWDTKEQSALAHRSVIKHIHCCIKIPDQKDFVYVLPPMRSAEINEAPRELSGEAYSPEKYQLPPEKAFEHLIERNSVSVTEVGNLAYIALYHKDEMVCAYAFNLIFALQKKFFTT